VLDSVTVFVDGRDVPQSRDRARCAIASSSSTYAVRALVLQYNHLVWTDFISCLRILETEGVKIQETDFTALKSEIAASPFKPTTKAKEGARIEGAVQSPLASRRN